MEDLTPAAALLCSVFFFFPEQAAGDCAAQVQLRRRRLQPLALRNTQPNTQPCVRDSVIHGQKAWGAGHGQTSHTAAGTRLA